MSKRLKGGAGGSSQWLRVRSHLLAAPMAVSESLPESASHACIRLTLSRASMPRYPCHALAPRFSDRIWGFCEGRLILISRTVFARSYRQTYRFLVTKITGLARCGVQKDNRRSGSPWPVPVSKWPQFAEGDAHSTNFLQLISE